MTYTAAIALSTLWALMNSWRHMSAAFLEGELAGSPALSLAVAANAVVIVFLAFLPVSLVWRRCSSEQVKATKFLPRAFVAARRHGYTVGMLVIWWGHLAATFFLARVVAFELGNPSGGESDGFARWVSVLTYKLTVPALLYWIGILCVELTFRRWASARSEDGRSTDHETARRQPSASAHARSLRFHGLVWVAVPASALLLSCSEKVFLEVRMSSLCKLDAGLKVYETDQLSPINRRSDGSIELQMPMNLSDGWTFSRIGDDEFRLEWKGEVLNEGQTHGHLYSDGRLIRNLQRVRRMSDRSVLAESVSYTRIGGELTPFGVPSSSNCPPVRPEVLGAAFPR